MKVLEFSRNNEKLKKLIESAISKHATEPENNYFYYRNNEEEGTKHFVFDFNEDGIILANYDTRDNSWILFPCGIIGKKENANEMLIEFCNHCLNDSKIVGIEVRKEVFLEFESSIKKEKSSNLAIKDVEWEQDWPIVSLKDFNDKLEGSRYYELRKIKSNIEKNHKIESIGTIKTTEKELKNLIKLWEKNRKSNDDPISHEYNQLVKTNFEGTEFADAFFVDKKLCGIVSGWKIPNSNSFYLAIVLHDYTIKNFGEFMYIETLKKLKKLGFDECNLGGSDEKLYAFKKKFLPSKSYKTVYCNTIKKNR